MFLPSILRKPVAILSAVLCCADPHVEAQGESLIREGKYAAEIPTVGILTLQLRKEYLGTRQADLTWLGIDLRCCWELNNGQILLYSLPNYASKAAPDLAFVLQPLPDGSLQFAPGGFLDRERLDLVEAGVWKPVSGDRSGGSTILHRAFEQRKRFFERGNLKPLPDSFPKSFVDVTALLCRDRHPELRAILQHPQLSTEVLDLIGETLLGMDPSHGSMFTLPVLGANPNLSMELQDRLFALRQDPATWRAVACNAAAQKRYYAEYLRRIREGDKNIRFSVARDPFAPREAWELALEPNEPEVLNEFTRNKSAPSDLLERVSEKSVLHDPFGLASNPATPAHVLEKLSFVQDKQVLWGLLRNSATPDASVERALRTLASASSNVRDTAASDPRLPPDLIAALAKDVSIQVRLVLAMNKGVSLPILEELAKDPYRMVSERARENMKRRFQQAYAEAAGGWVPLDQLNPNNSLVQDFTDAVKAGDVPKARQLLASTDDPDIRPGYSTVVGIILRENFDGCKEFLKEAVSKGGPVANQSLVTSSALTPTQIPWLLKEHLLSQEWIESLVLTATRGGREDLITACRENHLTEKLSSTVKNAALVTAVSVRQSRLVDFWVTEGAVADESVQGGPSAVDIAAGMYSLGLLRSLDTHGKYGALLMEMTKDFPPAPHSPFLGVWSNKRDGFSTVLFNLGPDGGGYMGASIASFPILWKPVGVDALELVVVGPKEGPMRDKPILLRHKPTKDTLVIEKAADQVMLVPNDQAGPFFRIPGGKQN